MWMMERKIHLLSLAGAFESFLLSFRLQNEKNSYNCRCKLILISLLVSGVAYGLVAIFFQNVGVLTSMRDIEARLSLKHNLSHSCPVKVR